MAEYSIPLAAALDAIRRELGQARDAGKDQELKFEVDDIEIELQIVVNEEAGGGGEVNIGVLKLGGEGKISNERTHRVRLNLSLKDQKGRAVLVSKKGTQRR